MSASHRKFGDLLEEGIKRVHITRKKPIGFILDEFGYELRPDDSSKGRYALGHWYYKRRIPASMEDVAKLARLIVTNSDVDREWLKTFLDSAGYPESDKFCDQFFLSKTEETSIRDESPDEQLQLIQSQPGPLVTEVSPTKIKFPIYSLGAILLAGVILLFALNGQSASKLPNVSPAAKTEKPQSILPTATFVSATSVIAPTVFPVTSTVDFGLFNGQCPKVVSTPAFQYVSLRSFKDFLNAGGSPTKLQSSFNTIVQNKTNLRDGRIEFVDLTGDGVAEVIVNAILDKGSLWQILGCNDGQYREVVDITDSNNRYLRFAVDLNGNKIPEIISYRQTQPGPAPLYEFLVQEWNGHQISDLLDRTHFDEIGKRIPSDIFDWQKLIANATVTTRDTNGDGLYELVIVGGLITPVPTCETRFERQFTETWAWDGASFQLADREYILPIYRFQRAADGDLAFALKQYDRALKAYQDVLFDVNLFARDEYLPQLEFCKGLDSNSENASVENEQEQLVAYARWRILLVNAMEGSEAAMQVVYQTLQEKFPEGHPGHAYAVIATSFWENYQNSQKLDEACESAANVAKTLTLYPRHSAENICFLP